MRISYIYTKNFCFLANNNTIYFEMVEIKL